LDKYRNIVQSSDYNERYRRRIRPDISNISGQGIKIPPG